MLRALDEKMLEAWCVASVVHRRAVQELAEQNRLIAPCPRNPAYSIPSPLIGIINRQTASSFATFVRESSAAMLPFVECGPITRRWNFPLGTARPLQGPDKPG